MGFAQKSKVPKGVCRSPLAIFCNGPLFFAIFGPARGQIYGKTAEKIPKNQEIAFFVLMARKFGKSTVLFRWVDLAGGWVGNLEVHPSKAACKYALLVTSA